MAKTYAGMDSAARGSGIASLTFLCRAYIERMRRDEVITGLSPYILEDVEREAVRIF
jgi:hypothetical protein